jgi:phosphoribosylcarboxyaminoimidazole (NCAIR) mutase
MFDETTMPTAMPLALIKADAAEVASLLSVELIRAVDVAVTARSPAALIGEFMI